MISTLSFYAIRFDTSGKMNNTWSSSPILQTAKEAGCRIELSILNDDSIQLNSFLKNEKAQQSLIRNIISQLKSKTDDIENYKKADDVNIVFKHLNRNLKNDFIWFISELSKTLRSLSDSYRLSVTIPAFDRNAVYSVTTLNPHVDRFIIDFTEIADNSSGGPLAPLTGIYQNNIKTCVNRYLSPGLGIDPSKLIVCLPYYGTMWKTPSQETESSYESSEFIKYITYSDVRRSLDFFEAKPSYDPVAVSAYFAYENNGKDTLIWFDDEKTLAAKYDYILQNGLGGVAIRSLGYDKDYGELWDALASKFFLIDTLPANAVVLQDSTDHWKWNWKYLKAKYEQYYFLFSYPCEMTYPKVLVNKWRKAGVYNNDRSKIKKEAAKYIGIFCILQLLLFLALVSLFIYRLKNTGDKWKWKKVTGGILLFQFALLAISFSMYLFLDAKVVGFGVSDTPQDCFDFPYGTLFSFLSIGIIAGVIITRYLVFPLLKKDEIP